MAFLTPEEVRGVARMDNIVAKSMPQIVRATKSAVTSVYPGPVQEKLQEIHEDTPWGFTVYELTIGKLEVMVFYEPRIQAFTSTVIFNNGPKKFGPKMKGPEARSIPAFVQGIVDLVEDLTGEDRILLAGLKRIATEHPETRKHLLPIIKAASKKTVSE